LTKKKNEKTTTSDYVLVGALIAVILIVGYSATRPLATVGVDTALPQITPLSPVHADTPQTGLVTGGDFNSVLNCSARVTSTSGIKTWDPASQPCFSDGNTSMWYKLNLVSGTIYDGIWAYDGGVSISYTPPNVPPPEFTPIAWNPNTPGYHQFIFGFPNQANNTAWLAVGFYITTGLIGEWSINGQPISHTTQTLWFGVSTLTFRFTQPGTATATSAAVTATKSGSPTQTLVMTKVAGGVWTGAGTFSDGVWQITMTASDGAGHTNTLTILGQISLGEVPQPTIWIIIIAIVVVAVAGIYYYDKKKGQSK